MLFGTPVVAQDVKLPSVTNSIGMELIEIPAGSFTMGSPAGERNHQDNEAQVRVTLTKPFELGKYEVTQGQWKNVMGTEPWKRQTNTIKGDNVSATHVNYDDATEFCEKLTDLERESGKLSANEEYRLPTEAEWEYACRAGTETAFSFGNDEKQLGEYAWFDGNTRRGEEYAHNVGLKKPNPWGLHDMHGNVWEWCSDWADSTLQSGTDPVGPEEGSRRVLRGGGWRGNPGRCRSAYRRFHLLSNRFGGLGFRVARSQSETVTAAERRQQGAQVAVETRPKMEKTEPVKKVFKGKSVTNSIGMELVEIPAGTFTMGYDARYPYSRAGVAVTLTKSFGFGKYEVTQGQWKSVMGTEPWKGKDDVKANKDCPATYVSWDDATEFCKKLTDLERKAGTLKADEEYRLPTDAEWECACRAGTQTAFSFGDDESKLGAHAWFNGNTINVDEEYAHEVAKKMPNPWGLHDMHGNVWEWCSDWHGEKLSGGTDPVGPIRGSYRVFRGGSWRGSPGGCRSAHRNGRNNPSYRYNSLGFRVARSQSETVTAAERRKQGAQVAVETRPEMEKPEPVKKVFKGKSVTNSIGMELIEIPAGKFTMGSPKGEEDHQEDEAQVRVTLTKPIGLGKYEVTQGQFKSVMGSEPWKGKDFAQADKDCPATWVSWDDATEFCKKLTGIECKAGKLKANEEYRLPTEAEWEYACRAGTETAFSFGDDEKQLDEHAWFDGNTRAEEYAHKVGLKMPNPWGLHDMHGNVWEWCSDWSFRKLSGGTDPIGPNLGSGRVLRGGCWWGDPGVCRSAFRGASIPSGRRNILGFRVARSQSAQ